MKIKVTCNFSVLTCLGQTPDSTAIDAAGVVAAIHKYTEPPVIILTRMGLCFYYIHVNKFNYIIDDNYTS